MITTADILGDAGLKLPSYSPGRYYTTCPRCSDRRTPAHRKARCLGITIDDRGACWGCSHCGWTGPEKGADKPNGKANKGHRSAAAAYHEYSDAGGVVMARKVRNWPGREPKCWWQHPDGKGNWIKGTGGARLPLYRLPELVEALAAEHTIVIPEGEKCVDSLRAIGAPATCNPDGAAKPDQQPKWSAEHSEQLRGADLVVMPDHDDQGYAHAEAIARMSSGIARRVRMLKLAGHWPQCPKGGDIADWLAAGHTREELDALIAKAPDWRTGEEAATSTALPLTFFADLTDRAASKPWLIKGVLARDETSSWIAPPGKGKSALLTDIAVHKAAGRDWRGFRTKGSSGVVYFALERADLVRRRLIAHRQRDGLGDLPIAVCGEVVDLLNRNCVDAILGTIRAAEQRFACEVGLAIFDTYSKGIAAGGGDEDKAKDQNIVQANLRRLFDRGCHLHIAGIGHTGKDESRGERGSNARLADVDLQIQITGDLIKTATVTKANDQAEGALTAFKLEPFEFPPDEDGEPFRTFIMSTEIYDGEHRTKRQKPSDRQVLALRALTNVTLSKGREPPADYQLPLGIKVVGADAWRDDLIALNALDPKAANPWARFAELRNGMAARSLIGSRDDLVWAVR